MTDQPSTHSQALEPQALDEPWEQLDEHERAEGSVSFAGRTLRVAIIAGGLTHERDISIRSGRRVARYLHSGDVATRVFDLDERLVGSLRQFQPDLVWPLVHGSTGEDGTLQDLLHVLDFPYVGSDAHACRLASLKHVAKAVLQRADVRVPQGVTFPQSMFRELGARHLLGATIDTLGLPLVVKPTRGGSALGVAWVTDAAKAPRAMVDAYAYGDEVVIERGIEGTEVAVSVVDRGAGPEVLPPVEIVTEGTYDYDARYNPGRSQYFVPARLTEEQRAAVEECALRTHEVLGLRHLSRTDMILDGDGTAWFLDTNVAPGLTEISLLPLAAEAEGQGRLADLYLDIVRVALRDAHGQVQL